MLLLTEFQGRASVVVDADADDAFATICAIRDLPAWNARIESVLEPPPSPLTPGAEWAVQMSVPPARWVSRSRALAWSPDERVFEYESRTDDDNPSRAGWRWTVTEGDDAGGTEVAVEWTIRPRTFWRRLLFARLRRSQLVRETQASLAALAYHLAPGDEVSPSASADRA